jgi:hypothetical protein
MRRATFLAIAFGLSCSLWSGDIATSAGAQEPAGPTPFSGIAPTKYLWVSPTGSDAANGGEGSPLKTIQAAADKATPGTAIMVKAGTYVENVTLRPSGNPDAPIWLVSADGQGAAHIQSATSNGFVVVGSGVENWIVRDLHISGGSRGIQFTMAGNFNDLAKNIVIEGNIVANTATDGIKIAQADNVHILDNRVSNVGEEGIDFVAVNGSVIARNDVVNTKGAGSIMVKGGSSDVLVQSNHVQGNPADGILIGGWTEGQFFRPGTQAYEARNVTVVDNRVEDVGRRPLNVLGGQDSKAYGNFFEATPGYYTVVNFGQGSIYVDPRPISKNVDVYGNVTTRADALYNIEPGNGSGLLFHDNATNGVWSKTAGPDAGVAAGMWDQNSSRAPVWAAPATIDAYR